MDEDINKITEILNLVCCPYTQAVEAAEAWKRIQRAARLGDVVLTFTTGDLISRPSFDKYVFSTQGEGNFSGATPEEAISRFNYRNGANTELET